MKKHPKYLLLVCLAVSIGFTMPESVTPLEAAAAQHKSAIIVVVEGQKLTLPAATYLVNGSVMLPMKAVLDRFGVTAIMQQGQITITRGNFVMTGRVNDTKVRAGNRDVRLTQAPVLVNGRLYVPARFISLAIDKNVTYDAKLRQVVIGYSEAELKAYQRTLFDAAMRGDLVALERILKKGVDPNFKLISMYGDNTPLDYAIFNNYTEAAKLLIEYGADVHQASTRGISDAIVNQNAALVTLLLTHGIDPNLVFQDGTSLLELASGIIGRSSNGSVPYNQYPVVEVVQALLDQGADPGIDDSLYQAVQAANFPIIQALLRAGADPDKPNAYGNTPYQLSTSRGIQRWMSIQAQQPVIPNLQIKDDQGKIMESGSLFIQSTDGKYALDNWFNWEGPTAYLDLPDGQYVIVNVSSYTSTNVLKTTVTIDNGQFDQPILQMPKPNVQGTAVFEDENLSQYGRLNLYDDRGSYICSVPLNNGQFQFYLQSGTYKF